MLLDSHHLNGIIAVFLHTWQNVLGEFLVGSHLLGILSHTHMAFVDKQRRLVGLKGFLLEDIGLLGIPYLS